MSSLLCALVCQFLISWATTANPLPASPADVASIVALSRQEIGLQRDHLIAR
jgi:hypothetical protein